MTIQQIDALVSFVLVIAGSVIVAQAIGLIVKERKRVDGLDDVMVFGFLLASGVTIFALGMWGWRS